MNRMLCDVMRLFFNLTYFCWRVLDCLLLGAFLVFGDGRWRTTHRQRRGESESKNENIATLLLPDQHEGTMPHRLHQ